MGEVYPHCEKFGYDENKITRRLNFLALNEASHATARCLHDEVIVPNVGQIIAKFYEMLLFHPESRRLLTTGEIIERLKQTQQQYLLSLGMAFDSQSYFEGRLHIGLTHAKVGIPLNVYQLAYRCLTQLILDAIPASMGLEQQRTLVSFVLKITTLDMTLATETYHGSLMASLEDEVKRMYSRVGELHLKASTDSLTGLLNRENSFYLLQQAIYRAVEAGRPLSVAMADLDHFKRINDNYGHMVGDSVLQETAARILASVRDPDIVGRYGGEEFLVILSDADIATARRIAERIRKRIADTPINVQGTRIEITISLGLASLQEGDDLNTLLKRADEALYAAKAAGRNCVIANN
jgi:diguanylate cyclase (GGDEF)-like protein